MTVLPAPSLLNFHGSKSTFTVSQVSAELLQTVQGVFSSTEISGTGWRSSFLFVSGHGMEKEQLIVDLNSGLFNYSFLKFWRCSVCVCCQVRITCSPRKPHAREGSEDRKIIG